MATLKAAYCETDADIYEIGVDEAGRGPMLGRVYAGAVILPKDLTLFNHALMKDSKRFHSEKKIKAAAEYIKKNAIAWAVGYADETVIDDINIRNATHKAMHEAIKNVLVEDKNVLLLVDGNDFTRYQANELNTNGNAIPPVCIEGGDNTYSCIAAASILAKVARDEYIAELCIANPILITQYDILKNKGYGTKKHMDGIRQYGITPFHRKTFGICKQFA